MPIVGVKEDNNPKIRTKYIYNKCINYDAMCDCRDYGKKPMLSEFQPYVKDVCRNCGMALWDCEDWFGPQWEDECWSGCDHEAANDPELARLDEELEEIIERIRRSNNLIRYYQQEQIK